MRSQPASASCLTSGSYGAVARLNSSVVPWLMLRNSGSTPMPSGSMRISSSSPPGRSVGLMHPTTPRQLVNAMEVSSRCRACWPRAWRANALASPSGSSPRTILEHDLTGRDRSLVKPDGLDARRQRQPIHAFTRIARRAGRNVVDQDRADLTALALGREGPHIGPRAADRSHLGDHAALDDAFRI